MFFSVVLIVIYQRFSVSTSVLVITVMILAGKAKFYCHFGSGGYSWGTNQNDSRLWILLGQAGILISRFSGLLILNITVVLLQLFICFKTRL